MITAGGITSPDTDQCGLRSALHQAGHLIAMDIGSGSLPGDGPGWKTSRGASLPFTTAVGHLLRADGAGYPGRFTSARYTLLHSLPSWGAVDSTCPSALAKAWAGSHSHTEKSMFRRTA